MERDSGLKAWGVGLAATLMVAMMSSTAANAEDASTASTRIAFVNTQALVEQAPQAVRASEVLQTEFSPRDQELKELVGQLKELEGRLARDAAIMSATEKRKLEREILALQRDFKRDQETFSEDLKLRRNEELAKLQREIANVVVEVAKINSFDMVLESGVVYANENVDITPLVLEALRNTSSAPAAPAANTAPRP